jgi:predicted ester cyclase
MTTEPGTVEANKAIVRRFYAAFSSCDLHSMDALLASDFRAHSMPPGCSDDAEGLKQSAVLSHAGLLECRNEIEEVIAQDDRVAVRYTTRAVHGGTLFGIPASGRRVTLTGIEVYRLAGGKIAEMWSEADMSQLFAAGEDTGSSIPAPS